MSSLDGKVNFEIKQGDLLPTMLITCLNGSTPVDLTGATSIKIKGSKDGGTTLAFSKTVTGNAAGEVTLVWEVADTATAGDIYVEVEVTWAGKSQTFPRNGYDLVKVLSSLPDVIL